MKNFFLILLGLVMCSSITYGQKGALAKDSLNRLLSKSKGIERVNILNELGYFKLGDLEGARKALEYTKEAKRLAAEYKYEDGYGKALELQGAAIGALGDHRQAIDSLQKALDISIKINNLKNISEAYLALGVEQRAVEDYASSLQSYKQALRYFSQRGDTVLIAQAYNNIANIYYHTGSYTNALDYYLKALILKQKSSKGVDIAKTYGSIALVYKVLENYSKALEYNFKAVAIQQKHNQEFSLSITYLNIGNIYRQIPKYDSAMYYYNIALGLSKKIEDEVGVGIAFFSIGNGYYSQEAYKQAIEYYGKSLKVFEKKNIVSYIILANNNIAIAYNESGNPDQALVFAKKAYELSDGLEIKTTSMSLVETFYSIYKNKGDYKKALEFHEKYFAYQDSLLNQQKIKEIAKLETNYEIKQRNNEIELLTQTQAVNALKLKDANNTRIFFIITTILLLLVIIITFSRYRLKKQSEAVLSEKNEELRELNAAKDKFFAIIAHDIRNPLSAFRSLSKTLSENHSKLTPELMEKYLVNLNKSSESLVELLQNLLQWALSQTNKLQINPQQINLKKLIQKNIDLLHENARQKSIYIETELNDSTEAHVDESTVDIVFRNLISNAIKFTGPDGKVKVSTYVTDQMVEISIEDNGIGISDEDQKKLFNIAEDISSIGDSTEKGTGLGLILCKEYITQNKGEIKVKSELGKGSVFTIKLPRSNEILAA